jgi:hypothetical protein
MAVIVLGALGATGLLATGLARAAGGGRTQQRWRFCAAAAATVCAVALLAGPFAYDLSTIGRAVTGNSASAGPVAATLGSPGSGTSTGGEDLSVDEGLIAYLQEHQGDAEYLVAVQTSKASVPIILATGEPVVTIGGYKSRDPYPTAERLAVLLAAGKLRYVFVAAADGTDSDFSLGEASAETETTLRAALQWVVENGTVVAADEYGGDPGDGTLYRLP